MSSLLKDLFKSVLSIIKILIDSKWFISKPIKTFEQIDILANGPSLNNVLPNYIRKKNTGVIVVNNFPNTSIYTELRPDILVLTAIEFFYPEDELYPIYVAQRGELFKSILEKTDWNILIVCHPQSLQFFKEIFKTNSYISLYPINITPIEGNTKISHLIFDFRLGTPRPHNVLVPAIMYAIYANAKQINLYGVDHSWLSQLHVTNNNEALMSYRHFYNQEGEPLQMNRLNRKRTLWEILEKFMYTFKSYEEIEKYAKSKNVKILNHTSMSYIDAFQKVESE